MLRPLLFNLYANGPLNHNSENAQMSEYTDDGLLFCSDSVLEIALNLLQEIIAKLENYFPHNRFEIERQ